MKKLIVMITTLTVLAFSPVAMAVTVYLDDGESHTIDTGYGTVYLDYDMALPPDPGTHVHLVSGGSVAAIDAFNNATVTMSGGSISFDLVAHDNATITLSGGSVSETIVALINSTIYLDGTDFEVTDLAGKTTSLSYGDVLSDFGTLAVDHLGHDYYIGNITGTLADGFSTLNNTFYISNSGDPAGTANIVIIPEPCTLLLLGLGGLVLCKRKA